MSNTTTDEQLMLLDDADLTDETEDTKSDGAFDQEWLAREAAFTRQIALEKAVQMARSALAHGRVSESNAADFTISAAEKFFAFLTQQ